MKVGQVIGAWWTVAILVLDSLIGAWLVRREGGRALQALREALAAGRMPSKELADGALVLIGGTLMLTPGFVTDAFGALLVFPLTRVLFRGAVTAWFARRITVAGTPGGAAGFGFGGTGPFGPGPFGAGPDARRPGPGSQGPVVRGEVVDDES